MTSTESSEINPRDFVWVEAGAAFCHVLVERTAPIASGRFCKGKPAAGHPVCRKHLSAWKALSSKRGE